MLKPYIKLAHYSVNQGYLGSPILTSLVPLNCHRQPTTQGLTFSKLLHAVQKGFHSLLSFMDVLSK